MATDGIIFTPYGNSSRFYLQWQRVTQEINNNRTLINWQAGIEVGGGAWWGTNSIKINSVNINGSGSLGSGTWSNISGNGKHQLLSGSIWIGHNADGTKGFSASLAGWLYANGDKTTSGSWDLPTIPRNSQVTTNKASYTLGEALAVYTNRKSSSFTHRIRIRQNNSSGTLIQEINSVGASTTWTPTAAQITQMQNMIPNSNTLTVYVESYNNQVGQASSTTVKLNLTAANPTFSNFTFADIDAIALAVTANNQQLVKGKSTLRVTISAANKMVAIKGASASHYTISYEGASYQHSYSASDITRDISNIVTIGYRTITVRAYDSRGNSTAVTKQVEVLNYADPIISATLTRANNFEDNTTMHVVGSYTSLDGRNSIVGNLEYRQRIKDGTWSSWTARTTTKTATEWTTVDLVISLNNQSAYEFEFRISDEFGQVVAAGFVNAGVAIFRIGTDGYVYNNEQPLMPSHVGQILVSTVLSTAAAVQAVYGGTWVIWGAGRKIAGYSSGETEFNASEKTGGAKTHTLTANQSGVKPHNHNATLVGITPDSAATWGNFTRTSYWNENGYYPVGAPDQFGSGTLTVNNATAASASESHNNLDPYITAYMYKRTT